MCVFVPWKCVFFGGRNGSYQNSEYNVFAITSENNLRNRHILCAISFREGIEILKILCYPYGGTLVGSTSSKKRRQFTRGNNHDISGDLDWYICCQVNISSVENSENFCKFSE